MQRIFRLRAKVNYFDCSTRISRLWIRVPYDADGIPFSIRSIPGQTRAVRLKKTRDRFVHAAAFVYTRGNWLWHLCFVFVPVHDRRGTLCCGAAGREIPGGSVLVPLCPEPIDLSTPLGKELIDMNEPFKAT